MIADIDAATEHVHAVLNGQSIDRYSGCLIRAASVTRRAWRMG